jgi:hypothetical protein
MCVILAVENWDESLPCPIPANLRRERMQDTEIDSINIAQRFRPLDIIKAEIVRTDGLIMLSIAEARIDAKNEGVFLGLTLGTEYLECHTDPSRIFERK